jgi:hypothetical protein
VERMLEMDFVAQTPYITASVYAVGDSTLGQMKKRASIYLLGSV